MDGLKLYAKYIKLNFLSGMQYKGWFIMTLQVMLQVVFAPISLIFMFTLFGNVGDWTVERILLIYAIALTGYGLAETFSRGFDYFPHKMIQTGNFDRVLLRPRSLFIQINGSYFHIHRISRVVGGMFAIGWSLWKQGIVMTLLNSITLFFALLGGFFTYTGVFVMTSGIAFFTIKGIDWIAIFSSASYHVTRCPINYMPKMLKSVFTFFIPMLVISYYPASAICGWGESYFMGLMALPAGILFFLFSLLIWKFGVKHYKSTGS